MPFNTSTRRKVIPLASLTQASGNPLVWELPRTGILESIHLAVSVTIAGTLSAPNALGAQAIIKRVRLIANSGIDLVNISGVGFNSLIRKFCEDYTDLTPGTNAGAAITATTFNLPVVIPVALNSRDPVGLFMLQNEQTLLQLSVEIEAAANLATGITTLNYTVRPTINVFTVPINTQDWPDFSLVHTLIEDSRAVGGSGDFEYQWPRGNTYLQVLHGLGLAQSGSDLFNRLRVRLNQSDFLLDMDVNSINIEFERLHGYTRVLGVAPVDLIGTSGLGVYGSARDMLYSGAVTDLATVITATGAGTLYTVRRQLIKIQP